MTTNNRINPKKLLNSKWTAVNVSSKEKHFMVIDVEFDDLGNVIDCQIEAIRNKRNMHIDWHDLKDAKKWKIGWH